MPVAALILRRTLAERQLISGAGQKPPEKQPYSCPIVANELATRSADMPLGRIQNHAPGG